MLLIVTDDQRATGTLHVMPETRRWFIRGGTRFTKAFATTPLCCPSRVSIFTGMYAHNHHARRNADGSLMPQRATIQRYLQEAGYRNGIFGKYLNSWDGRHSPPYFDTWATFSGRGNKYLGARFNIDGRIRKIRRYSTAFIASQGVRFVRDMEGADARPWFVMLSPFAPHRPATPSARYVGARVPRWRMNPAIREVDRSDKPPFVEAANVSLWKIRRFRREQLRSLMSVDDLVGKVFRTMDKLGETRDTIAFFLSDNGLLWGEHGLGKLALSKRPAYTPSVKIPFLVRWPGRARAGSSSRGLAANIDVAPTIMRAAGLTPDPDLPMDGKPLFDTQPRSRLLLEYFVDVGPTPEWASIRGNSFQYVEYYVEDGLTPNFWEYYDLERDPWQLTNLLGDADPGNDPAIQRLGEQLDRFRRCSGSSCP